MKKILLALMVLCSSAVAQPTYNAIATAYVTTTISQNVVFNSAMQAGGTFTFSALAHNGGGRPNENDTANVRIQFYTAGGSLVSSVNSNYNANLPINNWSQGNPAAQTDVPWSTLTISSSNCGGSCANVAYATVSMYGVDASYWAGDYGPWYRAPTLQHNGGSNLLYNPEFGPAYGYTAQGWTTNPGMGSCQGAWGGSNPCIVNSDGVPGTSTVGLVANQNGGGPNTSGGTTSGTAGGYNNTMSTTNAGAGTGTPQTAPPPPAPTTNWQPIRTTSSPVLISNIYPTSYNSPAGEDAAKAFDGNAGTKYLNFDKQNAGVTIKLSQGRVVQKFTLTTANDAPERDPASYKLYGSNDGVNWTLIKEGPLSLSDGRLAVSGEITVNNTTAYIYYFMLFPSVKDNRGNSVQIAEVTYYYDLNDGVTSTDTGSGGTPSNPGQAGSVCADCGPTVVSTSTSNSVSTSSSSSNTGSVSVSRPTPTGNYTDGFVGTTTVTTTTTTPVTTTTWSDGSTTTSNGTSSSTTSTTHSVTPTPGVVPTYSRTAPNTTGNSIYIKQIYAGSNNSVSLTQEGNNNAVTGTDSGWATFSGNGSIITTKQYGNGNILGLKSNGWGQNLNLNQGTAILDSANSIATVETTGNGIGVTLHQTSGNTASIKLTGDINTATVNQKGGTGNITYINAGSMGTGQWNTATSVQDGTNNLAIINLSGHSNTGTVNQTGTGHTALLNLINAGGANTVTVTQTGVNDTYSLQQTCTNPAGCSASVIRNK